MLPTSKAYSVDCNWQYLKCRFTGGNNGEKVKRLNGFIRLETNAIKHSL